MWFIQEVLRYNSSENISEKKRSLHQWFQAILWHWFQPTRWKKERLKAGIYGHDRIIPTRVIVLQWRHKAYDGVSNHRCLDCLHNRLFSSASLAFVRGIHQWPMNSAPKGTVMRKCFHSMTSSYEPMDRIEPVIKSWHGNAFLIDDTF